MIRLIILERSAFETLYGGQFTFKTIYAVILPADAVPQFFFRKLNLFICLTSCLM